MREIYVKAAPAREIAVVEDGALVEYLRDDPAENASAECIYLGRVERVVPGMKAAFVDIGQGKNGFLPLEEKSRSVVLSKLQSGMSVAVQVVKEAQGTKGAFLTRDITLCGQYVIVMPCNRFVGISARITGEALRKQLHGLGQEIAGERFGLVMRNASAECDPDIIREEAEALWRVWQDVSARMPTAHVPSLIHRPRTLLDTVLDDYRPRGIDRIVTNDPALASDAAITLVPDDPMEVNGYARLRDKALTRFVWLKSGGSLYIDACEAMTVIDVNTGRFTGKQLLEDTVLTLNLEACGEIARQTRLRNLGGIIIIDFIDMAEQAHRDAVQSALTEAFAADRIKTVIHGFTSLGLMEMTRKKTRPPLRDEWSKPCPACHGSGRQEIMKEESHE